MNNREMIEIEARNYLKLLTREILVDSVYLLDIDFDTEPFCNIMSSIYTLFNDVNNLNELIKSYENPSEKVLRKGSSLPNEIYIDFDRKRNALSFILANNNVVYLFDDYLNKSSSNSKGTR